MKMRPIALLCERLLAAAACQGEMREVLFLIGVFEDDAFASEEKVLFYCLIHLP